MNYSNSACYSTGIHSALKKDKWLQCGKDQNQCGCEIKDFWIGYNKEDWFTNDENNGINTLIR